MENMCEDASPSPEIAEVQGLYGPIRVAEVLIQKLWYRREFAPHALRTLDGKAFRLIYPGRWNRLGGPDFLGAEWEIEGRRVLGDVEIHFYERDWVAHGHDTNPAFEGVRLHVLVFDPGATHRPFRTPRGESVETLVLGPYLRESLEEYAAREALRELEGSDPLDLAAPLLTKPLAIRRETLRDGAWRRWSQKVSFASRRLELHGWRESCHQVSLEVLGYRANRVAMANLALRRPFEEWARVDEDEITAILGDATLDWTTIGMRPANFPRHRLAQYASLVRRVPDWPERFRELWRGWSGAGDPLESTAAFRRRTRLSGWRRDLRREVFGEVIASSRFDTILIDGLFPLLAVDAGEADLFPLWWHWFPGDLPDRLRLFLRTVGVTDREQPLGNGLQQGALAILAQRENIFASTPDEPS